MKATQKTTQDNDMIKVMPLPQTLFDTDRRSTAKRPAAKKTVKEIPPMTVDQIIGQHIHCLNCD